jgi:hypothetical protein
MNKMENGQLHKSRLSQKSGQQENLNLSTRVCQSIKKVATARKSKISVVGVLQII